MAEKITKLDDRLSFNTSKRLGNGPNSIVYKGKFEEIPVAVKHIMYEHSCNAEENQKEMSEMREKKIMSKIEKDRHRNIIGYYYSFSTADSLYLAMQLCDGNLKHYVKNQQLVSSYPPQWVNHDIASAVHFLHRKGVVHRDLKPENVFYVLREHMIERVLVGDFGLSKVTCDDTYTFTGHVGTQGYIPHEIISQFATEERAGNSKIKMTVKSDIFSMGCIFHYTVTLGQSPFGLFGQRNIADKKQPDFKHLKPTMHSLKCLLETLLSHNPEERPNAHFVLNHPAFWKADTILNFLKSASDDIESKANKRTNQSVIAELENPNIVLGTKWFNRLPEHLKHHLANFQLNGRYIYRENSDVRSALRIIRNVANHYKDFPKEAQEELEPYPDGHVGLWMRICPTLFMHVYNTMKDIRPKVTIYDAERKTETVIQQQRHPTQSDPGPSQACKEDVLGERNKNTQLTTITASSSQDGPIPVGKMTINRIGRNNNGCMASPGLADLDCDSDMEDESSGMETLQSLKKLRPGPYAKPVSVRVVACQKPVVYGEDKSCVNFSVADKTDYSKAVLFDKGQFSQIYEGAGLILRNVILKQGGEIVLTKQTKVFQRTPPNVPDHILKLAMELIRPQAPDIKTIEEAKTSPLRTMMSVIGKITQDTETNEVMVNNSPTKVRNIVIEDNTGNITIALWREHATACIRPGEYIRITHVAARNTAQGQSLQTTKHTTITPFEAPEELISDDITGIATDDITSEILTKAHGSIRVDNRLLEEKLNCTIDEIVQQTPVTVKFVLKGQELVRFVD